MPNLRFLLALLGAKLTGKLIRLLGRNGSHTPAGDLRHRYQRQDHRVQYAG